MVDIVVEPVGVDQLAGGAPPDNGGLVGVVVGEVVPGHLDVQPPVHVPPVFLGQGVSVVFQVAQEEELAAVLGFSQRTPRPPPTRPGLPDRGLCGCPPPALPVCREWGVIEPVVKSPEQGGGGFEYPVVKDPKEFLGQGILGNPIVVVEPRLGAPADVQGGVDMGFGPLHDLAQLLPVVHRLKVQVFYRGAGDDQAVVVLVLDLVVGGVEGLQVAPVHVLGVVADGLQQFHLDLQGGVGEFPQQLGLRGDLGGHQVENEPG